MRNSYRQFFSGKLDCCLPDEVLDLVNTQAAFFILQLLESGAEVLDHLQQQHRQLETVGIFSRGPFTCVLSNSLLCSMVA